MNERKEPTKYEGFFYYVCPLDGMYSGEMRLVRKNRMIDIAEILHLNRNGVPVELNGERLKCPKCKNTHGWHQLEKKRRT